MGINTIRKCHWCGKSDTRFNDMEYIEVGIKKPVKKCYHKGSCWDAFQQRQAFIDKELKELDDLNNYLEQMFNQKPLPSTAFTILQNIRNGDRALGAKQKMGKRYKQGYPYPLIQKTFEYCSETIDYAMQTKDFDSFKRAFTYACVIVLDKIYFVEQREISREQSRRLAEKASAKDIPDGYEEVEPIPKEKSKGPSRGDFTDFLDDDE